MPLEWSEVEAFARKRTRVPADAFAAFTIKNALQRVEREGDLWGGACWKPARLEPAIGKAQSLWR